MYCDLLEKSWFSNQKYTRLYSTFGSGHAFKHLKMDVKLLNFLCQISHWSKQLLHNYKWHPLTKKNRLFKANFSRSMRKLDIKTWELVFVFFFSGSHAAARPVFVRIWCVLRGISREKMSWKMFNYSTTYILGTRTGERKMGPKNLRSRV